MIEKQAKTNKMSARTKQIKKEWNKNILKRKYYETYLTRQQITIIRPKNVMCYSKNAATAQNEGKQKLPKIRREKNCIKKTWEEQ